MKLLPVLALLATFPFVACNRKSAARGSVTVPSPAPNALVISAATTLPVAAEDSAIPERVTFNAHIRPIFSNTCFACHGFDSHTRKADLRLDTPEGAYAKLKDSDERAIVPGDPARSAILKRIFSTDPETVMPPPDFHKDLTPRQRALVKAWIEQGAKYEQHWAFTPLEKPGVPAVAARHAEKVANPIDAFIVANLEQNHLEPSALADKATLLRRLSLDLTGLPPSPGELDAFLADQGADAYEKQVDRLLGSPHYGERMAVPWLDVVRFADTVGYHGDQNARIFPYRDYVIRAFNDNKPFDQFTTEQLAGDLLPGSTDEQKIATGFLRLNLMTREGGAQPGEYVAKSAGDRVRAIGAAWLGLTTGCCECHDHKFDPLKSKDFYSLGAFFADVRQWGVYADYNYTPNPELRGVNNDWPFPPEIYAKNEALETRISDLQSAAVPVLAATAGDPAAVESWAGEARIFLEQNPTGWLPLTAAQVTSSKETPYEPQADQSLLFTGPANKEDLITVDFPMPEVLVRGIRLEVLPDPLNGGKVGRQPNGKFSVKPAFAAVPAGGEASPLKSAWAQADRRTPLKYQNGDNSPLLEEEWRSAPALWEEPTNAASLPHQAVYQLTQSLPAAVGNVLRVTLATADIGRFRISVTPFGDAIAGHEKALPDELANALKAIPGSRSDSERRELAAGWAQSTTPDANLPKEYRSLRNSILNCRGGYAYSLVAQAVPPDKIPTSHILPRGNWMAPADEVVPAVPSFLPHESVRSDGARLTRLDLAKWLTDRENPLTARQFTNRTWKQFFGKGLSNVLDDLGNQGEWPSHPELLDWLSADFRDSGWDVKQLVRLMVTSRSYQQVSATRTDLAEIDPGNRLLAEQSARRLDAEFVRDNALAVSGLLEDGLIGGPSVKPYQPDGYWLNLNFPERKYLPTTGSDQYRRGVYMHWQRTFMHPMLAGFDAPSREECTADRFQSNSPQQALTLLNDPSFVEAARAFALRLLRENPNTSDAEKISIAMKRAVARELKASELESLVKFHATQLDHYRGKPEDAAAFLKVGDSESGTDQDPAEIAAWSQLCRVILNLHEIITRY